MGNRFYNSDEKIKTLLVLAIACLSYVFTYLKNVFSIDLSHLFIFNSLIHRDGNHFLNNIVVFIVISLLIQKSPKFKRNILLPLGFTVLFSIGQFVITKEIGYGLSLTNFYLWTYYLLYFLACERNYLMVALFSVLGLWLLRTIANPAHLAGFMIATLIFIYDIYNERRAVYGR